MARDWRMVALAVLTAVALASVCAVDTHAQASKHPAKAAKAPAKPAEKSPEAEDKQDDDSANAEPKAPAKKKRQDPVEAQRAIEAAGKLLQTGKADQAAQSLTATLAGGNLPPAIMAKALYVRGLAYRQQSKPAQAISDLTSALWLKGGLAEAERADAMKQRAAAYTDAGLTENGEVATAAAPPAAKERPPAAAKSWGAVTTPPDETASNTTGGGDWFKNWFNSAAPPAQAKSQPPVTASIEKADPPPAALAPPAPPPPPRVSSAWSNKTEVRAEAAPAREPHPAPPPHVRAEGKFRIQLATVRTQQEAAALAAKAKRELGGALAAREPEIDQAVLGNMGSFYRVRVGPFATMQETQAICAKVKGTGFDCMSVTQ